MSDKNYLISHQPTTPEQQQQWQTTTRSQIIQILITIEKLLKRVRQTMKCVINLHIDILVLESDVIQLIDKVKEFNDDLIETKRLDNLINMLKNDNVPQISYEWPYPLLVETTIDDAEDILLNS